MAEITLRNESKNEFTDISSESWRRYEWESGSSVTIASPQFLSVNNKSGGHRVLDIDGISHYIPSGWIHLCWSVEYDQPHFVK